MLNPLVPIVAWIRRHKHRIGLVAISHTAKQIEEYLFDWVLYGSVVAWSTTTWGAWHGAIIAFFIMAILSAFSCWIYLLFYDWAKVDCFGFELLKDLKEEEGSSGAGRLLQKILKLGDIPAFFALSIHTDPFMVTVYLRKREHAHKGLTPRDWKIFWASVLFSNAYWTFSWTVVIEVIRFIWNTTAYPVI